MNFGEYLLPSATEVPTAAQVHLESPSPLNPLGVKGAGEGGTIPAPAAIAAAIENALEPFGVDVDRVPVTPDWLLDRSRRRPRLKVEGERPERSCSVAG